MSTRQTLTIVGDSNFSMPFDARLKSISGFANGSSVSLTVWFGDVTASSAGAFLPVNVLSGATPVLQPARLDLAATMFGTLEVDVPLKKGTLVFFSAGSATGHLVLEIP